GYIEPRFLRSLERVVVCCAFLTNLARHAVETLPGGFGLRQCLICDGARNSAVAVGKRMDGHEPEMRQACPDETLGLSAAFEPDEKARDLRFDPAFGRRFIVNALVSNRAGDNLHRTIGVIAPDAGANPMRTRIAGRKQRRLPTK